jgi:hypothetical protein
VNHYVQEDLVQMYCQNMEVRRRHVLPALSRQHGRPITQFITVLDFRYTHYQQSSVMFIHCSRTLQLAAVNRSRRQLLLRACSVADVLLVVPASAVFQSALVERMQYAGCYTRMVLMLNTSSVQHTVC